MRRRAVLLAAVLAAALGAGPAGAAALGRLFASPEERAQLDARRDGQPAAPPANAAEPAPAAAPAEGVAPEEAPAAPPQTVLNGIVRRNGGKSTIWLNQVPQAGPQAGQQAGQRGAGLAVPLASGRVVVLKPGQRFNPADGSVSEDDGR